MNKSNILSDILDAPPTGLDCEGVFGTDAEVQLKAIQTSVNFRNLRSFQWCRRILKNREKFYYLNSYLAPRLVV